MKKVVKTKAFKDRLKGHRDAVITLFSPSGADSAKLLSASKDGSIRGWDLIARKISTKLHVSRIPDQSKSIPENANDALEQDENVDEKNLYEKEEQKIPFKDFKELQDQQKGEQLSATTFSENSIYGGYDDGIICSWNLKSGQLNSIFKGHIDKITQLQFLNPRVLISASLDHTIRSWDVMQGVPELMYKLAGPVNQIIIQTPIIYAISNKNRFYQINTDVKYYYVTINQ